MTKSKVNYSTKSNKSTNTKSKVNVKGAVGKRVSLKKKISLANILTILLIVIFVLSLVYKVLAFTYSSLQDSASIAISEIKSIEVSKMFRANSPVSQNVNSNKDNQIDIISKITKLVNLPNEDVVSISRIKDKSFFETSSAFYEGAEVGDYIVVYPSLTVIYDEKLDIVIRTGVMDNRW